MAKEGCGLNPLCIIGDAAGDFAKSAIGDAITNLAYAVMEAVGTTLAGLGSMWVSVDSPNLTSDDGVSASPTVAYIQGHLWWYMTAAAVLAVLVGATKMAWEQRAEPGRDLVKSLLTLVIVSGAGLAVVSAMLKAADGYSEWVLFSSMSEKDFGRNLGGLVTITASAMGPLGPLLIIVLGIVAILVSFVQIMLMVARGGMLVVLAGTLPLSAAATNTETGKEWFRKTWAWIFAWVLYKPAAATIYATGFKLSSSDASDKQYLLNTLVGIVLIVLAIVALPALIRFLTPMAASVAGGGSGGGMMATALPTGAMLVGSFAGSRGGSPPPPGSDGQGAASGAVGADHASGSSGTGGSRGPSGSDGPSGTDGGDAPSSGGASGGSGSAAGAAADSGASGATAAGSGASGAAAAGGPVGLAATGATEAVTKIGQSVTDGARGAVEGSTSEEGPSGSR